MTVGCFCGALIGGEAFAGLMTDLGCRPPDSVTLSMSKWALQRCNADGPEVLPPDSYVATIRVSDQRAVNLLLLKKSTSVLFALASGWPVTSMTGS